MALPIILPVIGAGVGLYSSIYEKTKKNEIARKEIDNAWKKYGNQKLIADRQFFLNKKRIQAEMLSQTLTTENQLRDIAIQQFQEKSSANAAAGTSGMSEGTVYSNIKLMSDVLRMKAKGIEQTSIANLDATQIGSELNKLDYTSKQIELDAFKDKIGLAQDELDWDSSIFSYAMTGLSGALSGAAIGNNIYSFLLQNNIVKQGGNKKTSTNNTQNSSITSDGHATVDMSQLPQNNLFTSEYNNHAPILTDFAQSTFGEYMSKNAISYNMNPYLTPIGGNAFGGNFGNMQGDTNIIRTGLLPQTSLFGNQYLNNVPVFTSIGESAFDGTISKNVLSQNMNPYFTSLGNDSLVNSGGLFNNPFSNINNIWLRMGNIGGTL